jgi:hypothetical protein
VISGDFRAVQVPFNEWIDPPNPIHEGERVLWSDGTARVIPERETEIVTVLRRLEPCDGLLRECGSFAHLNSGG